ncbi:MAG: hypothetical protein HQM08_25110 [Candidatus Riflebacteria bacterium]|nr:hypothetical protein [Candidatus Riflebacteria bacterium]
MQDCEKITFRRFLIASPLFFFLLFTLYSSFNGYAGSFSHTVNVDIVTDREESFSFSIDIERSDFRILESNPAVEFIKYLNEAKRAYADKIGYRKEIYGEENYKMVKVSKYTFSVVEITSGRVVLKKNL